MTGLRHPVLSELAAVRDFPSLFGHGDIIPSPCGQTVAWLDAEGLIMLDMHTSQVLFEHRLRVSRFVVQCSQMVSFSEDGNYLAIGSTASGHGFVPFVGSSTSGCGPNQWHPAEVLQSKSGAVVWTLTDYPDVREGGAVCKPSWTGSVLNCVFQMPLDPYAKVPTNLKMKRVIDRGEMCRSDRWCYKIDFGNSHGT